MRRPSCSHLETPSSRSARPPGGSSRPSTRASRRARRPTRALGPGAAPQVPPALPAAAGLPAGDRFALPALRGGDARPDPARRAQRLRPRDGHLGEIKATLYEQDNQVRVRKTCPEHGTFEDLISIDAEFSRRIESRFPGRDFAHPGRRAGPPPRHLHHQVRARRGAHHRPHQPLQHDVQPLLHGRQPGRLRARADHGGGPRRSWTTRSRSSRGGRCRCSSRAGSRRSRRTSWPPAGTPRRSATRWSRPPPTACASRSSPTSRPRRRKPASTWPTCSSTASPTRPTPTARSRTCSTSRRSPSTTCTRRASRSRRWSPS